MTFIAPGQGGYNGPRMASAPIAQAGADAFGAAGARDAKDFGKLGLNAGLDVLAAAQEQQRICDQAVARYAINQMRIDMLPGSERIMAEKGSNAMNARAEGAALFEGAYRRNGAPVASGGNIELQRMIEQSAQSMKRTNDLAFARKQVRGEIEAEQNSIDMDLDVESRELVAIASGNSPLSGDGTNEVLINRQGEVLPPIHAGDEIAKRINKGLDNIAARFAGYPPGYIKQTQDDWEAAQHIAIAGAMAVNNPRSALEYFDLPEVRAVVPAKEWKEQRKKLQDAFVKRVEAETVTSGTLSVIGIIDKGGNMGDVYRDLMTKYGTDVANKIEANAGKYIKYADEAVKEANEQEGTAVKEIARQMKDAGLSDTEIQDWLRTEKPKMVEIGMAAARDRDETKKADATSKELAREKVLDDEFNQSGGIVSNMPSYGDMTIDEKTTYLKKAAEYEKASAESNPKPSLDTYLELGNLTDDELNDRWTDRAQRDSDLLAMGGTGSEWSKKHIDRIDALAKAKRDAKTKPPEVTTLDTELNNIKRDIDLNLADTGRDVSDDERRIVTDRILNDYNDKLNAYITENNLEKVTQVPLDQRKRMRAESLLTYRVQTGWTERYGTENLTQAETMARGIDISNASINPGSLPIDFLQNYLGGTVRRIAVVNQDPVIADVGIPPDKAPESIRIAARSAGLGAIIVRDLGSGGYLVIGGSKVQDFDSNGENPLELEERESAAMRNAMTNQSAQEEEIRSRRRSFYQ